MLARLLPALALICLAAPHPAPAQFIQRTTCYRTPSPIQVDGLLDEAEWGQTERLGPFLETESRDQTRYLTWARLLWDARYLYVSIEAWDPDIWATETSRDGDLWTEEVLEVFVDPDGDGRDYVEWEVNPLGTALDIHMERSYADGGPANRGWNAETVQVAVHVEGAVDNRDDRDRQWSAEWAIPWEELVPFGGGVAVPPNDGDEWRLGLYRTDRPAAGEAENSAWSPTRSPSFHTPARFGAVLFSGASVGGRPALSLEAVEVVDGDGGNGLPDPGEELTLTFTITNHDTAAGTGLRGRLASQSPHLTVLDSVVELGAVGSRRRLQAAGFRVRVSADYEPRTALPMRLTVTDDAGHTWLEGLDLYLDAITSRPVVLSGVVLDPAGDPAAGATVYATSGGEEHSTATGPDGTYAMELPEGRYRIRIDPPPGSSLGTTHHGQTVELDQDTELSLPLARTYAVLGRITDPDGEPIPDVSVSVSGLFDDEYQTFSASTDEDGSYYLGIPRPSYYTLEVDPEDSGYVGWLASQMPTLIGELVYDVELPPGHTVNGRVLTPQGDPVTGGMLSLVRGGEGWYAEALLGDDGSYSLRLPAGSHELEVRGYGGSGIATQRLAVVVDGDAELDLVTQPGHHLVVEVVGPEGEPVTDGWLFLGQVNGSSYSSMHGNGGQYEVWVLSGEYALMMQSPPRPYAPPPEVTVSVRSDTVITLALQRGQAVRGRLVDAAGTAHDGNLQFASRDDGATAYAAATSAEGFTAFLAPGAYQVLLVSDDDGSSPYPWQDLGEIEVTADTVVDFAIQLGVLAEGRLVDADDLAVPGAFVIATADLTGVAGVATTDAEGRFEMSLLPGSYTFTRVGAVEDMLQVGTARIPSSTPLVLRVPGGAALAGTLTGPVDGGYVMLLPARPDGPRLFGYSAIVASADGAGDGAYRVRAAPGTYHVVAMPHASPFGVGVAATDVTLEGEAGLDLALPTGDLVALSGSVWRADGSPDPGALIQLHDSATGVLAYLAAGPLNSYEVQLPPGRYQVTAASSNSLYSVGPVHHMGVLEIADDLHWDIHLADAISAVAEGPALPGSFALEPNYPNPFNPSTTIAYQLAAPVQVDLVLYNALGQEVRRLVSAVQAPGRYAARWDGRDAAGRPVASGVYFYVFRAGEVYARTRRMLLVR